MRRRIHPCKQQRKQHPCSLSLTPGFFTLAITLCWSLLDSGGVYANPVYPGEQSLSNGEELYGLYCAGCHGEAPVDSADDLDALWTVGQSADTEREGAEQDETELADDESTPPGLDEPEEAPVAAPKKDAWPEWADRPDPRVDESDVGAGEAPVETVESLADLANIVREVYENDPEDLDQFADPDMYAETETGGVFEPLLGATDLSDPASYVYGITEDEMFNSIAEGTGVGMVGWRDELGGAEPVWDLVNYIRSFWSDEWRY